MDLAEQQREEVIRGYLKQREDHWVSVVFVFENVSFKSPSLKIYCVSSKANVNTIL